MKKNFVLIVLIVLLSLNFVRAEVIDLNSAILDASNFKDISDELSLIQKQHKTIVVLDLEKSLDGKDPDQYTREKFRALDLDKRGVPILNVLIVYAADEGIVRIGYGDKCGLDKESLDSLASSLASKLNAIQGIDLLFRDRVEAYPNEPLIKKSLSDLFLESVRSISLKIKDKINSGLGCSLNSERKGLATAFTTCVSVYKDQRGISHQYNVLFLGSGFGSAGEFSKFVDLTIENSFKTIQPFKWLSQDPNNAFYFLYGEHNLETSYSGGSLSRAFFVEESYQKVVVGGADPDLEGYANSETYRKIKVEHVVCPSRSITIVLDKDWQQKHPKGQISSYYDEGNKIIFADSEISGQRLMSLVGRSFGLGYEWVYPYAREPLFGLDKANCQKSTKNMENAALKSGLKSITSSYSYPGCTKKSYYRSSQNSIMNQGEKFNFLSCVMLINERSSGLIWRGAANLVNVNPQAIEECKKMYNQGELEQQ